MVPLGIKKKEINPYAPPEHDSEPEIDWMSALIVYGYFFLWGVYFASKLLILLSSLNYF